MSGDGSVYRRRGHAPSRSVIVAFGLLILVVTLANGGGPASVGFLLGIVFIAVGVGRLWIGIEDRAMSEADGAAGAAARPGPAGRQEPRAEPPRARVSACRGSSRSPTRRSASRSTSRSASSPTAASG